MGAELGLSTKPEHEAAREAAPLAKADLTTLMVREFPELQGVDGRPLPRAPGRPRDGVAARRALALPSRLGRGGRGARGALSTRSDATVFAAVSLADKLDTLAGYFGLGLAPTGSSDPFGLRRAAQGAVRVLLDFWPAGRRRAAAQPARASSPRPWPDTRAGSSGRRPRSARELEAFLLDRLRYVLVARGFPADEVEAVLGAREPDALDDPHEALRAAAGAAPRARGGPRGLRAPGGGVQARQEHPGRAAAAAVDAGLLERGGRARAARGRRAPRGRRTAATRRGCARSPALRAPVDRFFDDVLVMAEDPQVRANRLGLLGAGPLPLLPHRGHFETRRISVTQYVYFFGGGKADGNKDMKDLLGGKGAGLAEMTNAGLPVPPGFTISTAACNLFVERKGSAARRRSTQEIEQALERLEKLMGKKLGDGRRSAARLRAQRARSSRCPA